MIPSNGVLFLGKLPTATGGGGLQCRGRLRSIAGIILFFCVTELVRLLKITKAREIDLSQDEITIVQPQSVLMTFTLTVGCS